MRKHLVSRGCTSCLSACILARNSASCFALVSAVLFLADLNFSKSSGDCGCLVTVGCWETAAWRGAAFEPLPDVDATWSASRLACNAHAYFLSLIFEMSGKWSPIFIRKLLKKHLQTTLCRRCLNFWNTGCRQRTLFYRIFYHQCFLQFLEVDFMEGNCENPICQTLTKLLHELFSSLAFHINKFNTLVNC